MFLILSQIHSNISNHIFQNFFHNESNPISAFPNTFFPMSCSGTPEKRSLKLISCISQTICFQPITHEQTSTQKPNDYSNMSDLSPSFPTFSLHRTLSQPIFSTTSYPFLQTTQHTRFHIYQIQGINRVFRQAIPCSFNKIKDATKHNFYKRQNHPNENKHMLRNVLFMLLFQDISFHHSPFPKQNASTILFHRMVAGQKAGVVGWSQLGCKCCSSAKLGSDRQMFMKMACHTMDTSRGQLSDWTNKTIFKNKTR